MDAVKLWLWLTFCRIFIKTVAQETMFLQAMQDTKHHEAGPCLQTSAYKYTQLSLVTHRIIKKELHVSQSDGRGSLKKLILQQ